MSATLTHGTRKSLAEQIDRFDAMLDGLAEAIPEAVADAVRVAVAEAVREAVQHAITEVLTHPEVLARIREATTSQPAPTVVAPTPCPSSSTSPSPSRLRLWSAVARVRCAQACTALANRLQSARGWSAKHIQVAYRWRKPILAGLGAGFTVALASSLLGPLAGALLCAASVFTLVVVASVLASRPASPSAH